MTIIKGTTAKGQQMLQRYSYHEGNSLYDVYDRPSHAKIWAYENCADKCYYENGRDFGICSHNTFGFTVSWRTADGLRIETASNSYLVLID